jgi:hypothetical protein
MISKTFQDRAVRAGAFIGGAIFVAHTFSPEVAAASAAVAAPFSRAAWSGGKITAETLSNTHI